MTEQQPYELVRRYPGFELRRYPAHTVAEVQVNGSFDRAGSAAFRPLFGYISGNNVSRRSIAMTAPVVQRPSRHEGERSEKIPMTAPVLQDGSPDSAAQAGGYRVAFVLPAGMTAATAPVPTDDRVLVRDVPGSLTAALRFSGRWSEDAFLTHRDRLAGALAAARMTAVGSARFARFDPPFTPWFLRRNEILQDVRD